MATATGRPPRCVSRGEPAPTPAALLLSRLHPLPPSTALLSKWRPTASFPAAAGNLTSPSPAPQRLSKSHQDGAAQRHALGARVARGARLSLWAAPGTRPGCAGRSGGELGCACAPGQPAALGGREAAGRPKRREARRASPRGRVKPGCCCPCPYPFSLPPPSHPFLDFNPLPPFKI